MAWFRRVLLTVPFAIAAVLNVLMLNADRFHLRREHIAGYGFLFGTPWAWLLDRGWVPDYHHHNMQLLFGMRLFCGFQLCCIQVAYGFYCVPRQTHQCRATGRKGI